MGESEVDLAPLVSLIEVCVPSPTKWLGRTAASVPESTTTLPRLRAYLAAVRTACTAKT